MREEAFGEAALGGMLCEELEVEIDTLREALIHLTRAQEPHHIVQQCQQQIVQLS